MGGHSQDTVRAGSPTHTPDQPDFKPFDRLSAHRVIPARSRGSRATSRCSVVGFHPFAPSGPPHRTGRHNEYFRWCYVAHLTASPSVASGTARRSPGTPRPTPRLQDRSTRSFWVLAVQSTGIRPAVMIVLLAFVMVWVCVGVGFVLHPLWLVALAVFLTVTLAGALLGVRTSHKLPCFPAADPPPRRRDGRHVRARLKMRRGVSRVWVLVGGRVLGRAIPSASLGAR